MSRAQEALKWIVTNGTFREEDTEKLTEAMNTIEQALESGVDVESLKKEPHDARGCYKTWNYKAGLVNGWNDCIDHLAAQGHLKQGWEPIEGLDEALSEIEESGDFDNLEPNKEGIMVWAEYWLPIIKAARLYAALRVEPR